ncbi:hypothetical protein LV779_02940 [Streptomyces thinghirensis]|nr:hypothetical protein [Streptomyces thinghirensis]
MTFEGHIDRAPRLLPHREQGEALLAIREAALGTQRRGDRPLRRSRW